MSEEKVTVDVKEISEEVQEKPVPSNFGDVTKDMEVEIDE